jgi:hypothetical protein
MDTQEQMTTARVLDEHSDCKGFVVRELSGPMNTSKAKLHALEEHADYERCVCVWVQRFYVPWAQRRRDDDFLNDWVTNKRIIFAGAQLAREWVARANDCVYHLSPGEFKRPMYWLLPCVPVYYVAAPRADDKVIGLYDDSLIF